MGNSLTTSFEPLIYVACLAAYNNGLLHGAWIDVGTDEWAIWDGIQAMLKASPIAGAEEWAIHDYEGFEGIRIEENTGIDTLTAIAAFLSEHGTVGAQVLNYYSGGMDEAREAMEGRHLGSFISLADYVRELIEETVTIPQALRYYIDWQAMARDAEINGDVFTIEVGHDEVHVFAGC
jgi:antirestriction protein